MELPVKEGSSKKVLHEFYIILSLGGDMRLCFRRIHPQCLLSSLPPLISNRLQQVAAPR